MFVWQTMYLLETIIGRTTCWLGCSPQFSRMLGCPSTSMRSSNICSTFLTNEILIMVYGYCMLLEYNMFFYCQE